MTFHLFVEGSVQGVGFRQFVKHNAKKLNLRGWVRNLPDKRVEIMLNGDQENLRKMVEMCNEGPFLAAVKKVNVEQVSEQFFPSFDIIRQ